MARRRYEQRRRAESAQATRRRILDAVEQRLREAPTQPVSVDAVARTAGVSRSTVYLAFGSRAGLFEALAGDLWARHGLDRLTAAVAHEDAREHLRGAMRAGTEIFAGMRDVARPLFSMAALDPASSEGAITRIEQNRAGGVAHLARRLAEQGMLRDDVSVEEATDLLWVLAGFDAFDALYTDRGLSTGEVADVLVRTAERSLCR